MRKKLKNANVGVAVGGVMAVLGAIVFHGNEGLLELTALVSFAAAMGVFFFLDEREYRARNDGRGDRA